MDKFKEIRPIVLGVLKKNGKILVQEGYRKETNEYYYRCLGGGIEFLEKAEDALKREMKEEIGAEIEIVRYLGIFENIFQMRGKNAHELILLYEITMPDSDIKENYDINETDHINQAKWININDFLTKKKILYPDGMEKYLI